MDEADAAITMMAIAAKVIAAKDIAIKSPETADRQFKGAGEIG